MKHTLIQSAPGEARPEAFSGCSHGPAPAAQRPLNAPPIFVNGVAIPEAEIAQESQNHRAGSGPEARAAAARALVIRELLLQRAHALELTPTPVRDAQGREETPEEALVRQVLELEAEPADPSEAECRRVYERSPDKFTAPELFEASHILFAPDGDWDAARAQAAAAIGALAAGADFSQLASQCSACPTGGEGGRLGQLRRGDLAPAVEDAILSLEVGETGAEPVRTRHGWHVVRLDRRMPARALPFDAVEGVIREVLRARASVASSARYVAQLAAAAEIEGMALSFGAPP